jgi:hypothetical protein
MGGLAAARRIWGNVALGARLTRERLVDNARCIRVVMTDLVSPPRRRRRESNPLDAQDLSGRRRTPIRL